MIYAKKEPGLLPFLGGTRWTGYDVDGATRTPFACASTQAGLRRSLAKKRRFMDDAYRPLDPDGSSRRVT